VEKAYQQTKDFDCLSFLYLATGSTDKLSKMLKIADARGDPMSRSHNALYAGDIQGRIAVLREVGLGECMSTFPFFCAYSLTVEHLAYVTAKTNGLHELASEILESTGLTEADVEDLPAFDASSLKPPPIVNSQYRLARTSLTKLSPMDGSRVGRMLRIPMAFVTLVLRQSRLWMRGPKRKNGMKSIRRRVSTSMHRCG
jgi:hypothetical protein